MEEWWLLVLGFGIGVGRRPQRRWLRVRCWVLGFWRLVNEVRCWALWRWVLILWVLAAGEWWVLRGSLSFFFFFFGTGKHDWMETFLDQVEKWQRQLSGGENMTERGFFFFFVVIFSSSGFTMGCCNRSVFALMPKLTQDNLNKIEITEK